MFACLLTLFILGLIGCGSNSMKIKVIPSFYYWKTSLAFDAADYEFFKSISLKKMYVRFFDVLWDEKYRTTVPSNVLTVKKGTVWVEKVVPVIFITPKAIQMTATPKESDALAKNIIQIVSEISKRTGCPRITELQVDCDWIPQTRHNYFQLLDKLKLRVSKAFPGATLTCTIRLHQIKYVSATGVPPVDSGVLMIYHTSSPKVFKNENSILDVGEAKKYLAHFSEYPLPLDIALPVFSWGIQFNSEHKFIRVLEGANRKTLESNPDLKRTQKNIFAATQRTIVSENRVLQGDFVKLDEADIEACREMLGYIKDHARKSPITLSLFHYDLSLVRQFSGGNDEKFSLLFNQ